MRLRRVKFAFGKCYLWACKVVGVLMVFFFNAAVIKCEKMQLFANAPKIYASMYNILYWVKSSVFPQ